MAIATSQITIIDYNDALTLTGFISSNHPKTQIFNPDNATYNPSWTSSNLVLTPSLFKLGTTTDIVTSVDVTAVQWYEVSSGNETLITANANRVFSGVKNHILTLKTNELAGLPAKDYVCKITYRDPSTNLDLIHKVPVSFSRVINGGGIVDAIATAPDGNVFKNGTIVSLTAFVELWRGSVVDTTSVSYQWYKKDPSVSTDQGGGIGWRKLDGTTNFGCTGYTTNTLSIPATAVNVYGVFKVSVRDTDVGSNTYNQYFWDTISFIDNSDPIQVTVTSSGGDVFKNGVGSTTLSAKVFRAGAEIDSAGTTYVYKWYKYDQNANLVSNFGGAGIAFKTGKTLAVGDADVDVKATFLVEIE